MDVLCCGLDGASQEEDKAAEEDGAAPPDMVRERTDIDVGREGAQEEAPYYEPLGGSIWVAGGSEEILCGLSR